MLVGCKWDYHGKMCKKDRFSKKMKSNGWDNWCVVTSNKRHKSSEKCQYGRTATMVFNKLTSTIAGTGFNKTGLGQWSWVK